MKAPSAIRKALLLVSLVAALFLTGAWWISSPREPFYEGHDLSWWLFPMENAADHRALTREDFQAMGPTAVKWLIWTAEHGPTDEGRTGPPGRMHECLRKIFHRRMHVWDERVESLRMLAKLGPDAASAVPMLQRTLLGSDGYYASAAAGVLLAVEPAPRTVIEDGWREGSRIAREALVGAVGAHFEALNDPQAEEYAWCVQFLTRACADPDPGVRLSAVSGFFEPDESSVRTRAKEGVTPILAGFLLNAEPDVCVVALNAFPFSSPEAIGAIPRLVQFLNGPNLDVRSRVATILANMTSDPDPNVQKAAKDAIRNPSAPPDQ